MLLFYRFHIHKCFDNINIFQSLHQRLNALFIYTPIHFDYYVFIILFSIFRIIIIHFILITYFCDMSMGKSITHTSYSIREISCHNTNRILRQLIYFTFNIL